MHCINVLFLSIMPSIQPQSFMNLCLSLNATLWFHSAITISIYPCPRWILIILLSSFISLSSDVCSFILMHLRFVIFHPFFTFFSKTMGSSRFFPRNNQLSFTQTYSIWSIVVSEKEWFSFYLCFFLLFFAF